MNIESFREYCLSLPCATRLGRSEQEVAEKRQNLTCHKPLTRKHEEGYNISLSHGMSSMVALLSKLYSFDDLKSPELKK
ncbi:MAG: hypothetical protein MJZ85_08330 [Bacteroidales bacterium]|nr:hypothetical protein [Bacteroidales bacterium]